MKGRRGMLKSINELTKAAIDGNVRVLMEHITALTERVAEAEKLAFQASVDCHLATKRAERAEQWMRDAEAKSRDLQPST